VCKDSCSPQRRTSTVSAAAALIDGEVPGLSSKGEWFIVSRANGRQRGPMPISPNPVVAHGSTNQTPVAARLLTNRIQRIGIFIGACCARSLVLAISAAGTNVAPTVRI
jgi:hypothetical protein